MDNEHIEAVAEATEVIQEERKDAAQEVAESVAAAVAVNESIAAEHCEENHSEVIEAIETVAITVEETQESCDENAATLETIRQQLTELRESNLSLREQISTLKDSLLANPILNPPPVVVASESTESLSNNLPPESETITEVTAEVESQSDEGENPALKTKSLRRRARML